MDHEQIHLSLKLAGEIQRRLLPQASPALENHEIYGLCRFCDPVGGDYYDFIDLSHIKPGRIGIGVGDITGHGLGAALMMASARGFLRSQTLQHGMDLEKIFAQTNLHLVDDTASGWFMTLFYGILDDEKRTFTWNSAGHDPALWYHYSKVTFEELKSLGVPLGIFADSSYRQQHRITLTPGDMIVISTDGIKESRNKKGEMFGTDRLKDVIKLSCDKTASLISSDILTSVEAFRGTNPAHDDVALVVLKALA